MAKEAKNETATENTPSVSKFSKQQLIKSTRYIERRDLLNVLLKDDKQYSHADVERLVDDFMKGKVK